MISKEDAEKNIYNLFSVENGICEHRSGESEDIEEQRFGPKLLSKYFSKGKSLLNIHGNNSNNKRDTSFSLCCIIHVEKDSSYENLVTEFYDIIRNKEKEINKYWKKSKINNKLTCKINENMRLHPSGFIDYSEDTISFLCVYTEPSWIPFLIEVAVKLIIVGLLLIVGYFVIDKNDYIYNVVMVIIGTIFGLFPSRKPLGSFKLTMKETVDATKNSINSRTVQITDEFKTNKPDGMLKRGKDLQ